MKAKVKFDLAKIKRWLLEHGEKVALGVVTLVFLLFTWSAITREVLDSSKQPENLQQISSEVRNHVANSTWDEKAVGVAVVDYELRVKRAPLAAKEFELRNMWSQPLADPKSKRDNPALSTVDEPRAVGGFGTFALKSAEAAAKAGKAPAPVGGGGAPKAVAANGEGFKPSSSSTLAPQGWAVVTAIVPMAKQQEEFARALGNTVGPIPDTDTVHYLGYDIQRAEVNDSDPNKLDWKPMPRSDAFKAQWEAISEQYVIPPDYFDPNLTTPLGPLVYVDWDDSASHPKVNADLASRDSAAEQAETAIKTPEASTTTPAGDDAPIRTAGVPDARRQPAQPAPEKKTAVVTKAGAKIRLFRVFDFSVEAGKKYRYQVRLALKNPNFNQRKQHLKNPDAPQPEQLETAWSEPTNVVGIPDKYRILLASVAKSARNAEPAATILVGSAGSDGIEAALEVDVQRGGVAASVKQSVHAKDPRNGVIIEVPEVDFHSGRLVLDIRGGKPLQTKRGSDPLQSPGELLMMDRDGNITVRRELDDQLSYESRKPPEAPEEKAESDPIPETKPIRRQARPRN